MTNGRACCFYGGRITKYSWDLPRKESLDEYHRVTSLLPDLGCVSTRTVRYSGTSWIAIRMEELICTVTHSKSQEKLEKLDLFKICFYPRHEVVAVVSSSLGNSENEDGSGIAASLAEFNEKAAINFLKKALEKRSDFTYEDTVQKTISAFRYLFPGDIKADEIQVSVITKKDLQLALPIVAIEGLLENKNNLSSFLSLPIIHILQQKSETKETHS